MIDVRHTRLDHIFEMGLLIERLHLMKIYIECNSVIFKIEIFKRFGLFFMDLPRVALFLHVY